MFGGNAWMNNLQNAIYSIYVYNINTQSLEYKGQMAQPRWYATATTLPDGRVYIFGGSDQVGLFDHSPGADIYKYEDNSKVQVNVNARLNGNGNGNFYGGVWTLSTGDMVVMNSNLIQVNIGLVQSV